VDRQAAATMEVQQPVIVCLNRETFQQLLPGFNVAPAAQQHV
jgi:hypothetical protein